MLLWTFELVFLFFSDIYPGVELLDHMIVLFSIFFWQLHTVFHSGCTNLYSHPEYTKVCFPLQFRQYLLSFLVLLIAIINWCEATFHCGFVLFFGVFWKNVYSVPLPIFKCIICVFLVLSCMSSLYIRYMICTYFLRLHFHFVDFFFCCAEAL